MAGGKETPRQKMIGLMYLVLTALLALNVSTTVIDKFIFINNSLERSVSESTGLNAKTVASIKKTVEETGKREADMKVLEKAEQVRTKTQEVIAELNTLKKVFIDYTGGFEEGHEGDLAKMKGKTDYDKVGYYMMEEGEGHGKELKATLNGYASFLSETIGEEFAPLAKDADEDEFFSKDPNQKGKDFATLTFSNAPTPAAMASVSQLQTEVMAYETRALDMLASKVGAGDMKFDQIVAMVRPESKVVAAGATYKAELFLAASSTGVTPTMRKDGEDIEVINGLGQVEFTATPGSYNKEGLAEKSYLAEIAVTLPGGRDTVFVDTVEYLVAKPVIQIQSASVQALYFNCGNELNVQVPALGTNYNPSFSTKGGRTMKGSKIGDITVIPKSAEVTLTVSNNGNTIGTQKFKVKRIPKPEIKLYNRGREIDQKRGVKQAPRAIQLRAIADESFNQFLPKDARFRVTESEITLVRAGRGVRSIRGKGPEVNISQLAQQARSGDAIVVEVKKVQRANFRNEVEDFNNFGPKYLTIRIN